MEIAEASAKVVAATEVGVVVALHWRFASSREDHQQFETLKMRNGLVLAMHDYRQEGPARRALR